MSEQHLKQPQIGYEQSLRDFLGSDIVAEETFGRFNLALNKENAEDFVVTNEDGSHTRYLVTALDETTCSMVDLLETADSMQLKRLSGLEGRHALYRVPPRAKPLLNERLFPGRESNVTYISDEELFSRVGSLWKSIYQNTGHLPTGTVLAHTAMKEFAQEGEKLFPVPPFADFVRIEDPKVATEVFESSIKQELAAGYPGESVESMVASASNSFREV